MSGNRPVWRFFRFWSKYALYRRIYAYIRSFLSKIPKTVTVRWIPANPQRIQVGHPWVHLDGSDGVHGLAPCLRNPRCIFVSYRDLRWDFRHEHLKMSSPAGAHRCSRYVICSPDYSGAGMSVAGNVASCMAVTWLVRTDGFFATSRDTTSLDPADQSSNISSTNIVLQRRSSAVVGFLCRGLPIVELALLGPWRWVMPCRSQKVQFDGWHLRRQIFENIENSRNGLISDGVTISSKCQFTTCS